jgi:hypothetical protein
VYCSLCAVKVLLASLRSTLTVLARGKMAYRFTHPSIHLPAPHSPAAMSLPIGKIAAKAELARALPGRACVYRVAFTAFRVAHAPISAACAVDMRSERIAMCLHFADEGFHFNDGLAQVR